jgi:hypothetical protein
MVVDNHEYYQSDGAQRPRGSAATTGSEVRATPGSEVRATPGSEVRATPGAIVSERNRLADPRGAQRPRGSAATPGSRTRLGEPVSDDMSSRTGSVNFFKKNYFQTFKIFPTASDRVRSTLGDYDRCSNTVTPKRARKVATLWC